MLLEARGETLALAEAGSGGTLAATLSRADEAEQILAGAYIAPTTEKLSNLLGRGTDNLTGSISENQRIKQLAATVADATKSQWAIAVGQANSSGYVEVAFKLPDGRLESRQTRLRGISELARSRLSTQLLDQLRRRLK